MVDTNRTIVTGLLINVYFFIYIQYVEIYSPMGRTIIKLILKNTNSAPVETFGAFNVLQHNVPRQVQEQLSHRRIRNLWQVF